MTKYNPKWDLSSIPFEALEPYLKKWWGQYTRSKLRKKQTTPEERARLDAQAQRQKKYRERKALGEGDKTLDNVTL